MKKIIIVIILLLSVIFNGCIDFFNNINEDPIILRAKPYIEKIETNNTYLREYAYSIIDNDTTNSKEGYINAIYRHIVENFQYKEDPVDFELIKTPNETIIDEGGDCEDLTILLNSLLENIGIKTYLVMNETHAYSLVSDVNSSLIWKEIEKTFIELAEEKWGEKIKQTYNKTFILKKNELWYYGGNGSYLDNYIEYINITYEIISDKPINIYLVPSESDFQNLSNDKVFYQYKEYEEKNILKTKNQFSYGNRYGGIILQNEKSKTTKIQTNITFYLHPSFYEYYKNNTIKEYKINSINCIVLDCTIGEWGYPGYDAGIDGEKIAISPLSKEYYYLIDTP